MSDYKEKFETLKAAVDKLYYSAWWMADRAVDGVDLWTAVREAAELGPDRSWEVLGPDRSLELRKSRGWL